MSNLQRTNFGEDSKKIINKKKRLPRAAFIILFLGLLLLIAYFSGIMILKNVFYPLRHFDIIKQEAANNNIDPYLILSIIKTESSFKKEALSSKEAKGLMQILNSTASDINDKIGLVDEITDDNLYDENINIAIGSKYFSSLVKKYDGNYYLAICAYNAGMGNVDKWIKEGSVSKNLSTYKNVNLPFKETENYLNKVMSSYKMYKFLYK